MADQQPPTDQSTVPKPTALPSQAHGSQVPLPSMVPGGVFSPTTEKQVSDLLAEMQQYATTAAPGTTTTMQFSYQKSKHTTETSGQEPQVVESSHVEKAIHQSPPAEQAQQPQVEQAPQPQVEQAPQPQVEQAPPAQQGATSIFSQIPQFLQEKLGFGGGAAAPQQQQPVVEGHTSVSYQHSKKTTTTTTSSSSSGDNTVTSTEHQHPQPTAAVAPTSAPPPSAQPQPQPEAQAQHQPEQPAEPAQEGGFFAPLKSAAEKIGEQVGHIPQLLQETFGHHQPAETDVQQGDKHIDVSYQHSKKTTTTSSSTSTTSGDQQQVGTHEEQAPTHAPQQQTGDFQHLLEQATKAFPGAPAPGNVQIEFSKHASRQVLTQSGEQAPRIETTSSGYTQVNQGIFNGVPVLGGVVPVVVPVSITKSVDDKSHDVFSHEHHHQSQATPTPEAPSHQPPPQPQPHPSAPQASGTTHDASSQLEEQLKKLGLSAGHPVGDLLQQTLAQHHRAKTPESNIEIQYSAQRTHSSRTVTYETSGQDTKTAEEALQQLQSSLNTVQPPSQPAPEPPEAGRPSVQTTQSTESAGQNPPPAQGQ